MGKTKRFHYGYEDYEEGGKTAKTMVEEILATPDLADLEEIVIGSWGSP